MEAPSDILKSLRKIGFVCLLAMSLTNVAKASEPTIGSTSLCGDSYLIALAPSHIEALSWQSRSPLSRANSTLRALPQLWDEMEILTTSQADYILFGSGEGASAERLKRKSLHLTWGEDFTSIIENSDLISQNLVVDNIIKSDLTNRLDALETRNAQRLHKPKILYLARSGGSAGSGTFVDAAITAAGGDNIAPISGWFTPDPEEIIMLNPDLIITSYFEDGYESVQAVALRNKAVSRHLKTFPRVEIDGKLWPCAGPDLIEAAELIADAIDELP